jgi:hypothetical protein
MPLCTGYANKSFSVVLRNILPSERRLFALGMSGQHTFSVQFSYCAMMITVAVKAIFRGNQRAMNNAAILFYTGQGVARDRDEARNLWRQAADRGNLNAQANLGQDIASDVTASEAERGSAYTMLRDAALHGNTSSDSIAKPRRHRTIPAGIEYPTYHEAGAARSHTRLVASVRRPHFVGIGPPGSLTPSIEKMVSKGNAFGNHYFSKRWGQGAMPLAGSGAASRPSLVTASPSAPVINPFRIEQNAAKADVML